MKTLLQYVQTTLSAMDSDRVDSIGDTEESMQVADTAQEVYNELIHRQNWAWLRRPVIITGAADVAQPTKVFIPDNCRYLVNLWYDDPDSTGATRLVKLTYCEPDEFITRFQNAATNRQLVTTPEGLKFYVGTDREPMFYTTFHDNEFYCDSFDQALEATLQSNKFSALGFVNPDFTISDSFVPDLPETMVPLFQSTLTAVASLYYRQKESAPDEARVRRQKARLNREDSQFTEDTYYHARFGRR
jgi:hypothetical protein